VNRDGRSPHLGLLDAERPTLNGTASGRLRAKIELAAGPFSDACRRVFGHPGLRELLPDYLIRSHWIIRSTESLMEAAIGRARTIADSDPVAAGVASYLEKHVVEERDHDDWLLEDLEELGLGPSTVLSRIPSPTVARLAGSQYYWALHHHPVALLGYFALMEGFPPSPELIEDLIERTGYPRAAFRTLAEHGELDTHHRDELDDTIDSLPLTREHETLLALSVMSTLELLTSSIHEVLEHVAEDT
jgi:hypothetical protein